MATERIPVVFRRWRGTGTVIALFPGIPIDPHGRSCEAYEHVGHHGGADYHGVIRAEMRTHRRPPPWQSNWSGSATN